MIENRTHQRVVSNGAGQPLYFPEAERFHRSSRADWFLDFFEMFPSPYFITVMSEAKFTGAAWNVVWRKVSKIQFPSDTHEAAKASIALPASENLEEEIARHERNMRVEWKKGREGLGVLMRTRYQACVS
jgi:hypothetical protein